MVSSGPLRAVGKRELPKGDATKGEASRERIVIAAIDLFSKKGFDQVSVQEIALACRFTHTALLYHFKSKAGLARAAAEYSFENAQSIARGDFEKTDNAITRLKKFVFGYLSWVLIFRAQAQLLILLSYFASVHPDFSPIYRDYLKRQVDTLESLIHAGIREGVIRSRINAEDAARMLFDQLTGIIVNEVANREAPTSPEGMKMRAEALIRFMFEQREKKNG